MSCSGGLTLYINLLSAPARALTLLPRGIRAPYEEKNISFFKGEHKSEAYLKIHPFGTVPAVTDGDLTILESCTALRYIASKYDTSGKWYPADLASRVRVDEFLDWQHTKLRKHGVGYYFNLIFAPMINKCEPDMTLINSHKEELKKVDADMVRHFIKGRNFIAGEHVTIADLIAACELEQPMCANVTYSQPIMDYLDRVKSHIGPDYDQVHQKVRGFTKSMLNK
ncbi:unnamed protein product [Meganyctiphanes norvegica]|uniref:Uncharacterized protein n=1 Tax=Meganyctiphanes norvegica TaxID=48144 RepID=A0AAV2Q6R2_MEGNR